VISRTSSMRYKNSDKSLREIAHELGVTAIVEGSVRKIGDNVRITIQLIDTKTDTHLWSDTFDGNLSDVFSFQSDIALNVARELKAVLTSKETTSILAAATTTNQIAYDFYLKGNNYYSEYKTDSAILMYTQAIQEDHLFAAAYAKRANAHLYRYWVKNPGWQGHDLKAREDIKAGLEINPGLTELKLAEASAYYYLDRNYDHALRLLKKIKAETPNQAEIYSLIAFILRRQGKWEQTIKEIKHGLMLDPVNTRSINELCTTYKLMHQYDNQIECAKQGLLLIPEYYPFNVHIFNGVFYKTTDLDAAMKESMIEEEDIQSAIYYYTRQFDKLIESTMNDSTDQSTQFLYYPKTYKIALYHYFKGNKSLSKIFSDSAIVLLEAKIKEDPNDDRYYATLGKCYALAGDPEKAITFGKKAVELKPMQLDAWQGVAKEKDLMEIYIFTGNYDLAMDKMEALLLIPSDLHKNILSIDPIYDQLLDQKRFQKILSTEYKTKY